MDEAMDTLTLEELKEKFLQLLEITKCAVCLESVRKEMVQCVNGHLLCFECKGNLEICPTCRGKFSSSKPSHFISQVVEILPTRCKYKNCPTVLKKDDDHETYCGFKPTQCKWCSWNGPGMDIWDHCENDHESENVGQDRVVTDFDIDEEELHFTASLFGDEFFWEQTYNDPDKEMFTKSWQFVPNGKPEHDLFVTLSFKSVSGPFTETKIKLNLNPDENSEENSISVPHRLLPYFIDENGSLIYSIVKSNK